MQHEADRHSREAKHSTHLMNVKVQVIIVRVGIHYTLLSRLDAGSTHPHLSHHQQHYKWAATLARSTLVGSRHRSSHGIPVTAATLRSNCCSDALWSTSPAVQWRTRTPVPSSLRYPLSSDRWSSVSALTSSAQQVYLFYHSLKSEFMV